MTAVLGISGTYHDAAAALVVDGRVVVAIQEERLSRIKNDPRLPARAAAACLAYAQLAPSELDRVVYYEEPFDKLERVLGSTLRTFPRSLRQFPRAIAAQLGSKIWVLDQLAEQLGVPRDRVTSTSHHRAHAASAYYASGYAHAAVLTVDGVGEATSTAMWRGDGDALVELGHLDFPHSLGLLYAGLTAYLGFEVNEGEYKVMGLAAYGEPRLRDAFARLLRLERDGYFELDVSYFAHLADADLGFGPKLEQGDPRPPPMTSAALGLPIDPAVAAELAAELGLSVCRTDDPAAAAAELVARGKIAAWCQGRFEWGPRALGQRSILADPCDAESRERLNRAIKRREPFRPFAPAVLASRAAAYFDDLHAAADLTPFMTTVCRVRDPGVLAAVTHVDGTARVQTVADDAALAPVLRALPQPLVLNTSLNGPGEPIIASEQDALAFLLGHPIDALVLGDLVITKS